MFTPGPRSVEATGAHILAVWRESRACASQTPLWRVVPVFWFCQHQGQPSFVRIWEEGSTWRGVKSPRCSVGASYLGKNARPGHLGRGLSSRTLLQLCTRGADIWMTALKLCPCCFKPPGICLGLIRQTQVVLQVPDVGTSMPQGKSGHPLPAGTWCCGEIDRVPPPHPLAPLPGLPLPRKEAWALAQDASDHLPQGSRVSYRRDKLERRDGTGYLSIRFPHLHILHHSFHHSFVQDQPCQGPGTKR